MSISRERPGQYVLTGSSAGWGRITETDLAYMAGFFDGEGCVSIRNRGRRWECALRITGTNRPLMEHFSNITGAKLWKRRASRPWYKNSFEVCIRDKEAEIWGELLLPHLRIKADEVDLLLDFRSTIRESTIGGPRDNPSALIKLRNDIIATCRALKGRRFSL